MPKHNSAHIWIHIAAHPIILSNVYS